MPISCLFCSLRRIKVVTMSKQSEAGWHTLISTDELQPEDDVIQVSITAIFSSVETMCVSRCRFVRPPPVLVRDIQPLIEQAGLLPLVICAAVAHSEDRNFGRTALVFLKRFFPDGEAGAWRNSRPLRSTMMLTSSACLLVWWRPDSGQGPDGPGGAYGRGRV
jgi:hypothetical protein